MFYKSHYLSFGATYTSDTVQNSTIPIASAIKTIKNTFFDTETS